MDVPKIIWQTHNYEFNDLPDHLKKVTKNWMNLNPGWEYRYCSDQDRLKDIKLYPSLIDYYHHQTPAVQSDIWRFIVTYEHGGVYSDMDSVCIKPLDYMLSQVDDYEMLVVPENDNEGMPTNTANYAIKKNVRLMKNIIKRIDDGLNSFSYKQKDPFDCFLDLVTKSDDVLFSFTSARHTVEYKTFFDPDFFIDDYGDKIKYEDFLVKHNLQII